MKISMVDAIKAVVDGKKVKVTKINNGETNILSCENGEFCVDGHTSSCVSLDQTYFYYEIYEEPVKRIEGVGKVFALKVDHRKQLSLQHTMDMYFLVDNNTNHTYNTLEQVLEKWVEV